MMTFRLPATWLPFCPQAWHTVESPMRVAPRLLMKTVAEAPTLTNVPPCGQLHGPVSPLRCAPNPLMSTFGETTLFVPLLPCGQQGRPMSHTPEVLSPSLVACGIPSTSLVDIDHRRLNPYVILGYCYETAAIFAGNNMRFIWNTRNGIVSRHHAAYKHSIRSSVVAFR